jgi:hypothetical protein
VLCSGIPSFFLGLLIGFLRNDLDRGDRDVDDVKELIAAHPVNFDSLRINRGPADKFLIEGFVKSPGDLDLLRDNMVKMFGERRAKRVLAVAIRQE